MAHTLKDITPNETKSKNENNELCWPSQGAQIRKQETPEQQQKRLEKLSDAIETIIECIGEDVKREGLLKTPMRYAKALLFFTQGYEQSLWDVVNDAVFDEDHDEMVIVKNIEIHSLYMVPFTGKMHIGYIPNGKVLGLSKLARIAEVFSRRLQVQERLTKQVATAIHDVLKPQGVAVIMESEHLCMAMRGVQKPGSTTMTSCMLGVFRDDSRTRQEFLHIKIDEPITSKDFKFFSFFFYILLYMQLKRKSVDILEHSTLETNLKKVKSEWLQNPFSIKNQLSFHYQRLVDIEELLKSNQLDLNELTSYQQGIIMLLQALNATEQDDASCTEFMNILKEAAFKLLYLLDTQQQVVL